MRKLIYFVALLLVLSAPVQAANQSASITAQNTFTTAMTVLTEERISISVSGTFVGTVTLQRQMDATNWRDVETWTTEIERTYLSDEKQKVRIGIKTGDFTSGTAVVRLGTGL